MSWTSVWQSAWKQNGPKRLKKSPQLPKKYLKVSTLLFGQNPLQSIVYMKTFFPLLIFCRANQKTPIKIIRHNICLVCAATLQLTPYPNHAEARLFIYFSLMRIDLVIKIFSCVKYFDLRHFVNQIHQCQC